MTLPIVVGNAGLLAPGRLRWLRALGWMVALFVVTSFLLYPGWLKLPGVDRRTLGVVAVLVAYLGYAAAVHFGERRQPVEIAPRPLLPELLLGIAIGLGLFTLVFASLRLLGVYTMTPGNWTDWQDDIVDALRTGFAEELLLRLIAFRLLIRAFGVSVALIVSALLFGALHLANPNATWFAAIAIAIEAGLMLAAFYLLTGRIWTAIGVHAAWNFAQGPIFGARVSGGSDAGSLFASAPVAGAPELLSGGAFGPEASLSAILVGLAIFVVVLRATQGAGRST